MKINFVVKEKNIMTEIKPQNLSLEDIIRQQELAKYGHVVSPSPLAKAKPAENSGCLAPALPRDVILE
jgi:hypothetical protein